MGEKNKKIKKMNDVSKGYEAFIKGKEISHDKGQLFERVLKKAATSKPKQRDSK